MNKYTTITENSDGTKTAKIYSNPVRYKDEQGKWKNIDNSIVQTDKTKNPDYQYKNKSSDVDVLFSDNLDKSNAIQVNYKDYSIGFKPLDIEKEKGKSSSTLSFSRADKTKAKDNKFDKAKKYDSMQYSKTFNENADIQLTPNANGMKEDIILNQIPTETEFSYELNMKNAVPRLDDSGNLYFIDQKNNLLVATIASPSMCDSSKEQQFTYDIQVRLEKINDTTYKYTLTPSRAFLENKKTVYPVKIDPTLNIDQNYISDTFVSSRYPNNNYSSDYSTKVGYSSDLYVTRGLVKINSFPSQLTGAKIIKAWYSAYQDYAGTDTETVEIRKLLSSWNDSTVNYSNQPNYSSYVEDFITVTAVQRYTWNITYLVQNWFSGAIANNGMIIKSSDEGQSVYKNFRASNASSEPSYFTIIYTDVPNITMTLKDDAQNAINPGDDITVNNVNVTYSPSDNMLGTLYANDVQKDVQTAGDMDLAFNPLEYDATNDKWVYPEGVQAFLKVRAKDNNDVEHFTNQSYTGNLVTDFFDNTDGIYDLNDTELVNGMMKLKNTGGTYATEGCFQSKDMQINGRINYVKLVVDDDIPENTDITYKIVLGPANWVTIYPGYKAELQGYYKSFVLKAEMSTTDTAVTPSVDAWHLEVSYEPWGESEIYNDSFTDDKQISEFYGTSLDVSDGGSIKLDVDPEGGYTWGCFETTVKLTPGDVRRVFLDVDTEEPEGTCIRYYLSEWSGEQWTWQDVTPDSSVTNPEDPHVPSNYWAWSEIADPGRELKLSVEFESHSTAIPVLHSISLRGMQTVSGEAHEVKLIDEPDNLSAVADANYMTRLTWEPSTTTGVTYNVYRSETPLFTPSSSTLIASDLTTSYYCDNNQQLNKQFYYKVTAVKDYTIQSTVRERESVPSNEVSAQTVTEEEFNKKIGKKVYENPLGFDTKSGNGYINPASGNVLYQTSDLTMDSPIGSLAFSRAYNSQAAYTTPLGQGWDFNYNIALIKQYNATEQKTYMILKLGDGTTYRFLKNTDGTYTRPAGLYATLSYDTGTGKFSLTYKDKTVYLFNANNQIEKITDRNGNWIEFSYNNTGNMVSATDNVENEMNITYSTETGESGLIKTVAGSGKTYTYLYSNRKLTKAYISYNGQHGEEYTYTDGIITTVKNPGGYEYDIAYNTDANKKVTGVTNPLAQEMTVAYSTDNGDILVTTVLNHVTQKYYYDTNSLALKKIKFENDNDTVYTNDADFNVTHVTYPDNTENTSQYSGGNLTHFTDAAGKTTDYTYGDSNNPDLPTQVSEPFNGTNKKITDNEYDEHGNLTETSVQGIPQVTTYTYNAMGKVTSQTVTVTGAGGSSVSITEYAYDAKGRLIETTNPDDTTTQQTYDTYGNIDTMTDEKGIVTNYQYDILGRCTSTTSAYGTADAVTTSSTYDAMGNILSSTDGEGKVTQYTYDSLGRQTHVTNHDDTEETTTYTVQSDGTRVKINTDAEGNQNICITDKKGKNVFTGVLGTLDNNSGNYSATLPSGYTLPANVTYDSTNKCYKYNTDTFVSYDITQNNVMGYTVWSTDQTGAVMTNEYDNMGQVNSTTAAKGSDTETTNYTYDGAGNVLQVVSPEVTTVKTFDKLGRVLTDTLTKNGTSSTTEYAYDGVYNGKTRTTMTDSLERETVTEYDTSGRVIKETKGTKTTEYTYDDNGNMLTSTLTDTNFPNESAVTTYTYNGLNRKTKVQYTTGHYVDYQYDDNGNVTREILTKDGQETTTRYVYDDMNRVIEKRKQIDQGTETVIAAYTYTDTGNLESIRYGGTGTRKIGYIYDEAGKVITVRDWTNGGNLLDAPILREYFYTDGQLAYLEDVRGSNRVKQEFTYGDLNKLTGVKYYNADNSTVLEEYTIDYNDQNRISQETVTTRYGGTPVTVEKEYTYDNLGRLAQDTIGGVTTQYTYDAAGNRQTMTKGGVTYSYVYDYEENSNGSDQLLEVLNGQTPVDTYEYDLSGNQITKVEGDVTTTYDYDPANHLESVSEQDGQDPVVQIASYAYDGAGQRTQKTVGTNVTNYYYNGTDLLYTKDGTGATIEENVLKPDGSIISGKRANGNSYWYRQDVRGSITNIVDSTDNVVKSYTYEAYGNTTGTGTFVNSFAFTGAVNDEETGLYYMNARYYEPDTGRFISEDSYRGGGEAFWHLYMYCDGDPINCFDPTGHVPVSFNATSAAEYGKYFGPKYYNQIFCRTPGGDCTNFVSQCIWAGYGGTAGYNIKTAYGQEQIRVRVSKNYRQPGKWWGRNAKSPYPNGGAGEYWQNVVSLWNYATSNKGNGPRATGYNNNQYWTSLPVTIKKGDVLQFYNPDLSRPRYWHSVIVVSDVPTSGTINLHNVYVAQHSGEYGWRPLDETIADNVGSDGILFGKMRLMRFKSTTF
ncbi:MAG: DNRLRE domain-containing protein [Bacillota bacterium]